MADSSGGQADPVVTVSSPERLGGPLLHLQILIVLAVTLGGGGLAYGLRNLVIQLFALVVLAVNRDAVLTFWRRSPWPLVALVVASVVLPLIQLIPLPASLWQGLPGREPVAESFALAGLASDRWFPMSVDPMRTLVAFSGTLAPATIIVIGSALQRPAKLRLVAAGLLVILAAFFLGAVQLSTANSLGLLYGERTETNVFYATFANRNSTALMFVVGLTLLASLPKPRQAHWLFAAAITGTFFALAVFLTQSRTGMVLLGVPLAILLLRGVALLRVGAMRPSKAFGIGVGALLLTAAALATSYASGGRVADSVERFASAGAADRPEIWEDGLYAVGQYWPLGSGMGTFDEVFQLHESLEHVSPRKAGRAHSDWLEIAIEGGIVSLAIAAAWLVWILLAAIPRGSAEGMWMRLGGAAGLGAIAAQSLLDYPLRNQTLLCLAAVCVVMLVRQREERA